MIRPADAKKHPLVKWRIVRGVLWLLSPDRQWVKAPKHLQGGAR